MESRLACKRYQCHAFLCETPPIEERTAPEFFDRSWQVIRLLLQQREGNAERGHHQQVKYLLNIIGELA